MLYFERKKYFALNRSGLQIIMFQFHAYSKKCLMYEEVKVLSGCSKVNEKNQRNEIVSTIVKKKFLHNNSFIWLEMKIIIKCTYHHV